MIGMKRKDNVVDMTPKYTYKLRKWNYVLLATLLVVVGIVYYLFFPPISIFSSVSVKLLIVLCIAGYAVCLPKENFQRGQTKLCHALLTKIFLWLGILGIVVTAIGHITSMELWNASKYSSLLDVTDGDFATDLVETDSIEDIAIMDTASAQIIGNRAIGSLTDIVSQYEVSNDYSQIDYNGKPMKVASLNYAGLVKYFNNRKAGIPGYVMVDPVKNEAMYVKLDKPMYYTPSAYLNQNLYRHVQLQYPTYLFSTYSFELDNEGNPYYICSVVKPNAGLYGAKDVTGVVICDPCTGESQYYDVENVPNWVDRVFDGDLLCQKYDWYGTLAGGFWNSQFGNKGCKKTTDDYGYKVIDGDVWVYTGVTSVNGDESNIGFVLMNERTSEAKYFTVAGAEEYSAMSSAQGEVQHLGYVAAFPSLINISGEPTYIMALKDEAGLVKMYALVNVAKYNVVSTGSTQKEALVAYKKLLSANGLVKGKDLAEDIPSKDITISRIQYVTMQDETFVYITDTLKNVYKQQFLENESLILLEEGDKITVFYEEGNEGIHTLISFEE